MRQDEGIYINTVTRKFDNYHGYPNLVLVGCRRLFERDQCAL